MTFMLNNSGEKRRAWAEPLTFKTSDTHRLKHTKNNRSTLKESLWGFKWTDKSHWQCLSILWMCWRSSWLFLVAQPDTRSHFKHYCTETMHCQKLNTHQKQSFCERPRICMHTLWAAQCRSYGEDPGNFILWRQDVFGLTYHWAA